MIRNLIGFFLGGLIFILLGQIGGIVGVLGFIGGIAVWIAVATGRLDSLARPVLARLGYRLS